MVHIGIASDHGGYLLKTKIILYLSSFLKQYKLRDFGCDSDKLSVDYPDFIHPLCESVTTEQVNYGIAICGTGIGASIVCNRYPKVRAALCHNMLTTQMSRQHNDANVLVLGARILSKKDALQMVSTFFEYKFEGGRHINRLNKLSPSKNI